jgi:hypothetical protein
MASDVVIDYSGQKSGTFFEYLEMLQGRGRELRGLGVFEENWGADEYAFLYTATLSKMCSKEDDAAWAYVSASEKTPITKEQYEIFRAEGLFTESLLVFA